MSNFFKKIILSAKFVLSCLPRNNLAKKEETCRDLIWLEGSKNPFFRLRGQGGRLI
jgi:hypothetical protein